MHTRTHSHTPHHTHTLHHSFLFDLLEEEEAEEQFCVSYYEDATDSVHPETGYD